MVKSITLFRKSIAIVLVLLLVLTCASFCNVFAESAVKYIDGDGSEKSTSAYTLVECDTTVWEAGWYVVDRNVIVLDRIECVGEVHLILMDGKTLNAKSGITCTGEDNSLSIYGQANNSGTLNATVSEDYYAAIGGSGDLADNAPITINGGTIVADGSGSGLYSCGAGIGGGDGGNGSDIIINGGNVTAIGGATAAGIGGGYKGNGTNITINGGNVTANGHDGAGIGGGFNGNGSEITINSGNVLATGTNYATGIGGGEEGGASDISINGGTIIATGGSALSSIIPGLGGGYDTDGSPYTSSNVFIKEIVYVKVQNPDQAEQVLTHNDTDDLGSTLNLYHSFSACLPEATFLLNGGTLTSAQISSLSDNGWVTTDGSRSYKKAFLKNTEYSSISSDWSSITPSKNGFNFKGWENSGTALSADLVYTAIWEAVPKKEAQSLWFANTTITKNYKDENFSQKVKGAHSTVTYSVGPEGVASINASTGEVTILKAGTTKITATAAENSGYKKASVSYTLVVQPIKLAVPEAVEGLKYNGETQCGVLEGELYTLTNNTGIEAKDYVAVASLKDKDSYVWDLEVATSEDQNIAWSIETVPEEPKPEKDYSWIWFVLVGVLIIFFIILFKRKKDKEEEEKKKQRRRENKKNKQQKEKKSK